ncbi:MAG: hypothetical protein ABSA46_12470 [Thermodesulfovibrionales bacterium]|jgi:hypothetical protein
MLKESCPGSKEIRNPYPAAIVCFWCESVNEIWSDETETACKECGKTLSREMAANCLVWCPAARECVGAEKYERLIKTMHK